MDQKKLVSIVMPAFNSSAFIDEAILSVSSQSYSNWELLIVDDNSSDDTLNKIKSHAKIDDRIRYWVSDKNIGAAQARNIAIERANGSYIAFLDSDDVWLENKLEVQLQYMKERNVAFSCSFYDQINENGELLNRVKKAPQIMQYKDMLKSNRVGCLTAIYSKDHFGTVLMPDMKKRQDYALWLKLIRHSGEVHCVQNVLAKYRVRANSISSNKLEMLRYNWTVYRHCERFGFFLSLYYLAWNVFRKIKSN